MAKKESITVTKEKVNLEETSEKDIQRKPKRKFRGLRKGEKSA